MGAKAHVLHSRLLRADEYWALLNKTSVAEIAAFLKQTEGYKNVLRDVVPETEHRMELEMKLHSSLFDDGEAFSHYMNKQTVNLFFAWRGLYEADQLKKICRRVCAERTQEAADSAHWQICRIKNSELPYDALLQCADMKGVIEALRGTRYYMPLLRSMQCSADALSQLDFELAVDRTAEGALYDAVKSLPAGGSGGLIKHLFGVRADLINLSCCSRCRWYFNMPREKMLSFMLPAEYKLSREFLYEAAQLGSQGKAIKAIEKRCPEYGRALRKGVETGGMARALNRVLYKTATAVFRSGTPGFHTAIAYLMLKIIEISDIVKLTEAVRYSKGSSAAAQYLVIYGCEACSAKAGD